MATGPDFYFHFKAQFELRKEVENNIIQGVKLLSIQNLQLSQKMNNIICEFLSAVFHSNDLSFLLEQIVPTTEKGLREENKGS